MANEPKIHPAFDMAQTNAESISAVAETVDKKLEQAIKIGDALAFFRDKVWEFEDAVERAFDEWVDHDEAHDDEIEDLQEQLEGASDDEKKRIEERLRKISADGDLLHAKYEAMQTEVAELKERGASLEKADDQAGAEAIEYLNHLQALLRLSPLSKPVEE